MTLAPKPVTVHALDLTALRLPEVDFSAHVSTGTYVRSLARDMGRALSCGAHLKRLRRTSIGPFSVESAVTLDELDAGRIGADSTRSAAGAMDWLPTHTLQPAEIDEIEQGRRIACPEEADDPQRPVALVAGDRLVAIARVRDGVLQPERVFHE